MRASKGCGGTRGTSGTLGWASRPLLQAAIQVACRPGRDYAKIASTAALPAPARGRWGAYFRSAKEATTESFQQS
ncbi:hypothetical protein San01_10400 [Streptomyces angustmyceticus]|uniref:Uncharacterized protein n=1 Tax=Streptomyces angustmyceticus TaxID=285578 RepID=A0A5J4L3F4_9ACTN|nr:hypothetical protein San01_10400 [Streptomyces angustmyceticus]